MPSEDIDPLDAYMNSLQPQIEHDLFYLSHDPSSLATKTTSHATIDYSSSDEESAFEVEQAKALKAIGSDLLLTATPDQIMA